MLQDIYVKLKNKKDIMPSQLLKELDDAGIIVKYYIADIQENIEHSLLITDEISMNGVISNKIAVLGYGIAYCGPAKYVLESFDGTTASYYKMVYARFHKQPVTVFETSRLIVREITEHDLPELYAIYNDDQITEFVEPLYDYDNELEFTRKYIENMYGFYGYGLWVVHAKDSGEMVGRIGLENREIDGKIEVELGYVIGTRYQRKGYAYECCMKVMEYAFDELAMEGIFLCTNKNNLPSIKLAKKLGFELYAQNINGLDVYSISNAYFMNETAFSL